MIHQIAMLFLCVLSLLLHNSLRPFALDRDNNIQTIQLSVLILIASLELPAMKQSNFIYIYYYFFKYKDWLYYELGDIDVTGIVLGLALSPLVFGVLESLRNKWSKL